MTPPDDLASFGAIADLLPEPMLLLDASGVIHAANGSFLATFGRTRKDIIGQALVTMVATPPERVLDYLRRCISTSQFLYGALTLLDRNEGHVPCRAEGAALKPHRAGDPRRIVLRLTGKHSAAARFVDLTQQIGDLSAEVVRRRRAEQVAAEALKHLQEQEQQLRELANSIPNLASIAGPDGVFYWFNEQWLRYTGKTSEEMMDGWRSVLDPRGLEDVLGRWHESVSTGVAFEMVFPLRSAKGEFRRFLSRVNPIRDGDGRIVHWFGTNTDVENELRANETNAVLREREQRAVEESELQKRLLYSLFMQAPTLIAVLKGPDCVISLANPPLCELWRCPEEHLRQRPFLEAMPELCGEGLAAVREACRTGVPYFGPETAVQFIRSANVIETVYLNLVYSPFRNVRGEVEGAFLIASNVTDQVLARQQIQRLREEAEAANRAKDEFLAMLGHELRNPLSPILTAIQLMKLRGDETSERERTVIERQVTHLTRLVDDLLDVSRIARGKVELKRQPVELADIVASAIETASPLLEQRRHALTVQVPRRNLMVHGDQARLSQVVANLLTNAAKYTQPGGEIQVLAGAEGAEMVLRVRDSGQGIDRDVLSRVFEPFVQGTQAIDRMQGGLGLGLSIVRNLTERHGGSVSAHSEGRGQGSEFVIRLPRLNQDTSDHEAAPQPPVQAGLRDTSISVLVVDDNRDSAEMLTEALKALGYRTQLAFDAPSALRIARTFMPQVAFLDIGLPVVNGYELAGQMRQIPALRDIRLIAVTGYGQESDREKSAAAGFQHHLVKPVDLAVLERLLATTQVGERSREPAGSHRNAPA